MIQPTSEAYAEQMTHYIVAGRPFDVACGDLLTREFRLSWLDRFPPERPRPPRPSMGGEDASASSLVELGGDDVAGLVELPPVEPVNRSNRVKYRCPRCAAQVWGKPGLVVLCGQDGCEGATFEAV